MGASGSIECDTVQIIEPQGDFLIDTAGSTSDLDERGSVILDVGQTAASVLFQVPKLNTSYNFEYLYVDVTGHQPPGGIHVIPTRRAIEGFDVVFAGAPIDEGYVLHWRVTVVRTSLLILVDHPEDLYILMPPTNLLTIPFTNPRSGTNYGFSELRVENLIDDPMRMPLIRVQVVAKTVSGFTVAVNPIPRAGTHFFLKVRTP